MYNQQNVLRVLVSLGVHIGHFTNQTLSTNNSFIVGSRHGITVMDIKYIIISLQRATHFIYQLGTLNGDLLFHITSLHRYNIHFRYYFVHAISVVNKQRLFDEKWVYGQFSNYKQNVLEIINKIFFLNRTYTYYYKRLRWLFKFKLHISKKRRQQKIKYKLYKHKHKKKRGGRQFDFLFNLGRCDFMNLLVRVFFYSYFKRLDGVSFKQHQARMLKFFKFIVIFKHFRTFLYMPDAFILFNPDQMIAPLSELLNYKIPVVGLLDTNSINFGLTYPIYSNDDSILLVMFYVKLFLKILKLGKFSNWINGSKI